MASHYSADDPVDVLNDHLSQLVGHYVLTKVIRVHNKGNTWFDDQCRIVFGLHAGGLSSVDP